MKGLKTADIFAAMRVIKAAGMKEELRPIMKMVSEGESSIEDIGIDAILTVVAAVSGTSAERAIYDFLASPFEMSAEEVADLDLDTLVDNLEKLAAENDLRTFFKRLSGLMSSKSLT